MESHQNTVSEKITQAFSPFPIVAFHQANSNSHGNCLLSSIPYGNVLFHVTTPSVVAPSAESNTHDGGPSLASVSATSDPSAYQQGAPHISYIATNRMNTDDVINFSVTSAPSFVGLPMTGNPMAACLDNNYYCYSAFPRREYPYSYQPILTAPPQSHSDSPQLFPQIITKTAAPVLNYVPPEFACPVGVCRDSFYAANESGDKTLTQHQCCRNAPTMSLPHCGNCSGMEESSASPIMGNNATTAASSGNLLLQQVDNGSQLGKPGTVRINRFKVESAAIDSCTGVASSSTMTSSGTSSAAAAHTTTTISGGMAPCSVDCELPVSTAVGATFPYHSQTHHVSRFRKARMEECWETWEQAGISLRDWRSKNPEELLLTLAKQVDQVNANIHCDMCCTPAQKPQQEQQNITAAWHCSHDAVQQMIPENNNLPSMSALISGTTPTAMNYAMSPISDYHHQYQHQHPPAPVSFSTAATGVGGGSSTNFVSSPKEELSPSSRPTLVSSHSYSTMDEALLSESLRKKKHFAMVPSFTSPELLQNDLKNATNHHHHHHCLHSQSSKNLHPYDSLDSVSLSGLPLERAGISDSHQYLSRCIDVTHREKGHFREGPSVHCHHISSTTSLPIMSTQIAATNPLPESSATDPDGAATSSAALLLSAASVLPLQSSNMTNAPSHCVTMQAISYAAPPLPPSSHLSHPQSSLGALPPDAMQQLVNKLNQNLEEAKNSILEGFYEEIEKLHAQISHLSQQHTAGKRQLENFLAAVRPHVPPEVFHQILANSPHAAVITSSHPVTAAAPVAATLPMPMPVSFYPWGGGGGGGAMTSLGPTQYAPNAANPFCVQYTNSALASMMRPLPPNTGLHYTQIFSAPSSELYFPTPSMVGQMTTSAVVAATVGGGDSASQQPQPAM